MELEMLKTIIEKTLGRNMDAITEKTTFVDDLGVDSLDFFQILIDLEETFDVRIAPEDAEEIAKLQVIESDPGLIGRGQGPSSSLSVK